MYKTSKIGNRNGHNVLKDSGPPALLALLFPPRAWSNPASGPEFLSPLNPVHPEDLSMPPLLTTQPPYSRVGTCSVNVQMHSASSLALSFLPPPPASSRRHPRSLSRITWCHSISGSTPLLWKRTGFESRSVSFGATAASFSTRKSRTSWTLSRVFTSRVG